jgi:two-component system, LytTR family, response regulator
MKEVGRELEVGRFCRAHRSAIVNLERVARTESDEAGGTVVVLTTGARMKVSRRYRRELLGRLGPVG